MLTADPVAAERSAGAAPWWPGALLAAYAIAVVVGVLRRPDFLLRAQLWAEDGPIWFQQAHELGSLAALPLPYAGYYHLFPRLAGAVAVAAGVPHAPLAMNALSALVHAAPVPLALALARSRREAWFLAACAALYVFMPYSRETHFSATTAIWPLGLCLFLLVARAVGLGGDAPAARGGALGLAGVAACGLSGPFAPLLLPVLVGAVVARWRRRGVRPGRVAWAALGIVVACAALQLALLAAGSRGMTSSGAPSPAATARILGGQIALGGMLGEDAVHVLHAGGDENLGVYAALALLYIAVVARAAVLGDGRLRAFLAFAHLVLVAGVLFAPASNAGDVLTELVAPQNGQRYWLLPTLGFLAGAAQVATATRHRAERAALALLLPAFLVGAARDFRIAPLRDLDWSGHAARYCALAEGEAIRIPTHPEGWHVDLERSADPGCP